MTPPRRKTQRSRAQPPHRGRITVIAGVNGAGKSSVVGATIREAGGRYFNPDEEARALLDADPAMSHDDANAAAWQIGRRGLERAIARREDFVFETTLGGRTIAGLLTQALDAGEPALLLRTAAGRIAFLAPKQRIPSWAQPIVVAAILADRERAHENS